MGTVNTSTPAVPLLLDSTAPRLFRDVSGAPCMLPISGASNYNLKAFSVRATGGVQPTEAVDLTIILYAQTALPTPAPVDPTKWIALGTSVPSSIGGAGDPPETMWLMAGVQMMYSLASGKLQGAFNTNIADDPQAPIDFQQHITTIKRNTDPALVFAIGAKLSVAPAVPIPLTMALFEQID